MEWSFEVGESRVHWPGGFMGMDVDAGILKVAAAFPFLTQSVFRISAFRKFPDIREDHESELVHKVSWPSVRF